MLFDPKLRRKYGVVVVVVVNKKRTKVYAARARKDKNNVTPHRTASSQTYFYVAFTLLLRSLAQQRAPLRLLTILSKRPHTETWRTHKITRSRCAPAPNPANDAPQCRANY